MRLIASVLAIALLSALGGCGDKDPSSSAGSAPGAATSSTGAPAATAMDACAVLSVADVGAIVGGDVAAEEVPGGGCRFAQEDPRAPSAGVFGVVGAGGGFAASKGGNATDGAVETVSGLGDGAWLAVGRTGGDNLQGQGVVAVGDQLINVTVTQGNGLDAGTVKDMMVKLMGLAAAKA